MRRLVLTFVAALTTGFAFAQFQPIKGALVTAKSIQGVHRLDENLRFAQAAVKRQTVTLPGVTPTPIVPTIKTLSSVHLPPANRFVNSSLIQTEALTIVNNWAGSVWVEKYTYGEGSRAVSDWHLMATNTTGTGHCVEGVIIVDGKQIPIVGFVPSTANSKKSAVSIYHLNKMFSVKSNSFHSVEEWKCP